MGMGSALVTLGRNDEALGLYQKILPRVPEALTEVTRLTILKNLRLPPHRRQWTEVQQSLNACKQLNPVPPDLCLLQAEFLAGQGKLEEARSVLHYALRTDPNQLDAWIALAELVDRDENSNQALTVLDKAQAKLGDKVEIRLARASYWSKRKGAAAHQGLAQAEAGWDLAGFSFDGKAKLLRGLAKSYAMLDDLKKVAQIWNQLAQLRPWDLDVQLVLFDLAIRNGEEGEMGAVINDLKKLERFEGTLWQYAQASLLIWREDQSKMQRKEVDNTKLQEARRLLTQAAKKRPNWGRIVRLEGQLDELQGNRTSAIENYKRAIDLGVRNPSLIQKAVQILNQEERFLEAFEAVQRMQRLSGPFLEDYDFILALRLAREASAQSRDFRDHLWLGQLLAASIPSEQNDAKQKADLAEEAEKAFRQTTDLCGDAADPWVARISFLVQAGMAQKAKDALKEMNIRFSPAKALLARAFCHEIVDSPEEAQRLYEEAKTAKESDVGTLRAVTSYYLRKSRIKEAEECLTKIVELKTGTPEDIAWGHRTLSILWASQGDYQYSQKALGQLILLDEGNKLRTSGEETTEDLRTKAFVLAAQPRADQRRRAIPILERLMERQPTPDDQLLLAQVYEGAGNWAKAKEQFARLTAANGDNPKYLAAIADALLRHQELDECENYFAKLERLPDTQDSFAATEAQARFLAARNQSKQAITKVHIYATGKTSKPDESVFRLELGATLLDSLIRSFPAERIFGLEAEKMYLECANKRPDRILLLASFLGRQGRLPEALDCCEQAWNTCSPLQVAQTVIAVLHQGPIDARQYVRVNGWLRQAIDRNPKSATAFMVLQADLLLLQGNVSEAAATYRDVLMQDNRNAMALNNLAWILALKQGKGPEALELAKQAIQIMGPNPSLLDTRGIIYLTLGRANLAVKDLESAVAEKPNPIYCFHLARALLVDKNPDRAKQVFKQAKDLGLNPDRLDPLERGEFPKIRDQLESN